jgi:pyruvate kinase
LLQKELIQKANSLGIPIITATQMLDSMASSPRPTRAEVSDVANAILDGTDAVMLSNETAVGDYPIEAVETMATIARRIERDYPQRSIESHLPSTIPNAISSAVSTIASQLNAAAILPLTKSGATAHNVSKFRPAAPVLAITSEVGVARKLQLVWGVTPLVIAQQSTTSGTFTTAMSAAQDKGLLKEGDLVIQTAGTLAGVAGSTDLVKVGIVSAVLGQGTGVGQGTVSGRVRLAQCPGDACKIERGEILVVHDTTADDLDAIRDAAAVITEVPAATSHAAVIAQRLGTPLIAGVAHATRHLLEGEVVTLQIKDGLVHRGTSINTAL